MLRRKLLNKLNKACYNQLNAFERLSEEFADERR